MYARLTGIVMMGAMTLAAAGRIEAAPSSGASDRDHFGAVLELDAEFGGDNIAKVYYTNGVTQDIRAGQGVTLAVGAHGDGYVPDISFDDAIGGTVGAGWRWFGIEYTSIRYKSSLTGTVDGSSVGATFAWKF